MTDVTELTPEELRKATVKAYKHLGFLLDLHPDLPAPDDIWNFNDHYEFKVKLSSYTDLEGEEKMKEKMAKIARALRKSYFRVEKDMSGNSFSLTVPLGDVWKLVISCDKAEVCERRVVGTRTVSKPISEYVTVGHEDVEEEIVEWDCSEPLLAATS